MSSIFPLWGWESAWIRLTRLSPRSSTNVKTLLIPHPLGHIKVPKSLVIPINAPYFPGVGGVEVSIDRCISISSWLSSVFVSAMLCSVSIFNCISPSFWHVLADSRGLLLVSITWNTRSSVVSLVGLLWLWWASSTIHHSNEVWIWRFVKGDLRCAWFWISRHNSWCCMSLLCLVGTLESFLKGQNWLVSSVLCRAAFLVLWLKTRLRCEISLVCPILRQIVCQIGRLREHHVCFVLKIDKPRRSDFPFHKSWDMSRFARKCENCDFSEKSQKSQTPKKCCDFCDFNDFCENCEKSQKSQKLSKFRKDKSPKSVAIFAILTIFAKSVN